MTHPNVSNAESEEVAPHSGRMLQATVFLCGMSIMGLEMSASRLLAPFFGTSLFVWTNLIGAMMTGLSLGYWIGGRIADRHPSTQILHRIIIFAGLTTAALPFIAHPVMSLSREAILQKQAPVMIGSLLATTGLFAVPMTLLGMVSPFAIRLAAKGEEALGATAGSLYALSTAGSILGTFLPSLIAIPSLGTRRTILSFAAVLIVTGAIGLARRAALAVPVAVYMVSVVPFGAMPLTHATSPGAVLIEEDESLYHYIQVQRKGTRTLLALNEGHAVHSIHDSDRGSAWYPLVGSVWDSMNALPLLLGRPAGHSLDILIIGLAAGTMSQQLDHFYSSLFDLRIDGVEIDGRIVELGRKYFDMNAPSLKVHVMDGRMFLARSDRQWDLIMCDAYRQPYIPFHLATQEYFSLIRSHLAPGGLMSINVGSMSSEGAVLQGIKATVKSVFGAASMMTVKNPPGAGFDHYVIIAGRPSLSLERLDPTVAGSLAQRVVAESNNSYLQDLLKRRMGDFSPVSVPPDTAVLVDDRAPVELLTDWMIARFAATTPEH